MFGYKVNEIALLLFVLMSLSNMWINVVAVVKRKKDNILGAMWNLTTMFYIVASVLIVSCLSPSNVVSRKARFLMYFFGFGFSKLVVWKASLWLLMNILRVTFKSLMLPKLDSTNLFGLSFFPSLLWMQTLLLDILEGKIWFLIFDFDFEIVKLWLMKISWLLSYVLLPL